MVYTINLKSGTFRGDYEPWEVTFRENVESRCKSGVSGDQKVVREGPGLRGLGAGAPGPRGPGGPRPLPGNSCTNGLKSGL